ncbi:MAG: exported protein of unknown function [Candidatus Saccharibacteria bacterium]|nr:exported protein of unknown function [Candidatus Saccharibacteria bacterium]
MLIAMSYSTLEEKLKIISKGHQHMIAHQLKKTARGFTIVELLIVIVVIGILAAITIVSYNGITARANAASAKASANTVLKKAEAYNTEPATVGYPVLPNDLLSAPNTASYAIPGITFVTGTAGGTTPNWTTRPTTAPSSPSQLEFISCGLSGGMGVYYWDYASTATDKWTALYTGGCTSGTWKSSGANA